ncbi:MAG: hypothetical protein H6523_12875 [Mycolicibacterium sp.]|nr:hypothetical protein [Mycolicibacterium sp.]
MTVSLFSRSAAARRRFAAPAAEAARARGRAQAVCDANAIAGGAPIPTIRALPALWGPDDPGALAWREQHARMRMLAELMLEWGLRGRQAPTNSAEVLERSAAAAGVAL